MNSIKRFIHNSQLGLRHKRDIVDLQFLLPRLECTTENVYSVQGRYSTVPPFSVQFCRVKGQEHIYALSCEDGEIIFMNSNLPAKEARMKQWNAHSNAVFDVSWLSQSQQLITASGDQTAALWDTTTLEKVATFKGHASSVKTISLQPSNENVFMTGSRDGNILLWDSRIPAELHQRPVGSITSAHDGAPPTRHRKRLRKGTAPAVSNPLNSITCVLFQNDNILLSTGASDWTIKGWDIRRLGTSNTTVPVFNINNAVENHKAHGYTSMVLNPNGTTFFANCTDGTISQYEVNCVHPPLVSSYHGHSVGTFFVKMDVSCDGQFIISGASNDKAYIWKVSKPGIPVVTLEGHDAEVTAVAWHPTDITKLVTCGDDEQVFHWNVGRSTDATPSYTDSNGRSNIGSSHLINPEDVRLLSHRHLHTPLSYTTPVASSKILSSPNTTSTPSTAGKASPVLPPLTQWFTPKAKTGVTQEATPVAATSFSGEAFTPVKTCARPVFGELGNSDDRRQKTPAISAIRRTINFGNKSERKVSSAGNPSKRPKLNNYSIKNFFQASPRQMI